LIEDLIDCLSLLRTPGIGPVTFRRRARGRRELLGPSPVPVDEIVRLSGGSSGAVQVALLEPDLAERLDHHAAGKVSLRPA
jgi:DNA processing protein